MNPSSVRSLDRFEEGSTDTLEEAVDRGENRRGITEVWDMVLTLEFQAGRSRSDAMNGLARRMKLPMTKTLASMIAQAESLGVSMALTLQVLAQEMRTQRSVCLNFH